MKALIIGPCHICGQYNCSCQRVLATLCKDSNDTQLSRKKMVRFRQSVRDAARKAKRGLL